MLCVWNAANVDVVCQILQFCASRKSISFQVYVNKSMEPIIAKVRDHLLLNIGCDTISKSITLLNQVQRCRSKVLHGQSHNETTCC